MRSEMSRFNKNDMKGRYNLTYHFISKKLKQNTHLVHKYTRTMYRRFVIDVCEDPNYGQYVAGVYEVPYIRRPTEKEPFVGRIHIDGPADAWEGSRILFNT